jgi:hypothetical protein
MPAFARSCPNGLCRCLRRGALWPIRKRRDNDLRSRDFLNAEEFLEISFTSWSVEKAGENTGKVTGDVAFPGQTVEMTLDLVWNAKKTAPLSREPRHKWLYRNSIFIIMIGM